MLAFGNQGRAYQGSKTLFAEMLTNKGSLKIQFYCQVSKITCIKSSFYPSSSTWPTLVVFYHPISSLDCYM
jgi:hypothetical protein